MVRQGLRPYKSPQEARPRKAGGQGVQRSQREAMLRGTGRTHHLPGGKAKPQSGDKAPWQAGTGAGRPCRALQGGGCPERS